MENKEIIPDYRIDMQGEPCPYPAINTLEAMKELNDGEILEIISDCPQSINNIPVDAKNHGYKVLLIDDFLANGEAAMGASRLIKESGADLTGIGILIEKSFQKGRKRLEDAGYYVYSQARVGRLDKDLIEFLPEDAPVLEGVDEQELLDK